MLLRISYKWLTTSLCIVLGTTAFGFLPEPVDEPPKKKRKLDKPIPSLKLLAAKEVAKLLQSNYMDTFDADPHAVMAKFDLVVDPEVRTCIASKLLKTYKAHITVKNIIPGITLKREGESYEGFAFSNDGRLFAYSRYYGRDQMNAQGDVQEAIRVLADLNRDDIQIIDAHTGELLYTINNINAGGNPLGKVTKLCFDKENKALAVGRKSGDVQAYALQGQVALRLPDQLHNDKITCLRYHPNNKTLVSGSRDGYISLVDVTTGQLLQRISTAGIHHPSRPVPV